MPLILWSFGHLDMFANVFAASHWTHCIQGNSRDCPGSRSTSNTRRGEIVHLFHAICTGAFKREPTSHKAIALSETPVASEARIRNWSLLLRCGLRRKSAVLRILITLGHYGCGAGMLERSFAVGPLRALGLILVRSRAQPHKRCVAQASASTIRGNRQLSFLLWFYSLGS